MALAQDKTSGDSKTFRHWKKAKLVNSVDLTNFLSEVLSAKYRAWIFAKFLNWLCKMLFSNCFNWTDRMILHVVCHNSRESFCEIIVILGITAFWDLWKDVREEVSELLKKIKSIIYCQLIEESKKDQCKKYSVFDDLQDVSKQKSVASMAYDLAFWWRHNFKTSRNLQNAVTLKIMIISKRLFLESWRTLSSSLQSI